MERYEKYKDSGVEWIGKIPEGWEARKLKYVLSDRLKYGANESALLENRDDPRYIRITDFGNDGKLREDTFKSLPFEVAEEYLLQNGDILFARSGATVGKTFHFKNFDGMACFAGYLIKASPNQSVIVPDFLYFFTKSGLYESWKESIFSQATIQNIGADKFAQLDIPLPSIRKQTTIVRYLNRKTTEIDNLIAQKERLIELYEEEKAAIINQAVTRGIDPNAKLKDSGVDWLGEIPDGWDVRRLGHLYRVVRGSSPRPAGSPLYFNGTHTPWITVAELTKDDSKFLTKTASCLTKKGREKSRVIMPNTLLLSNSGATLGVPKITLIEGCINDGSVAFLSSPPDIDDSFIYYYLSGLTIQLRELVQVSGQPNLNTDIVKALTVGLPSKEEQATIVQHIETEIDHINAKIAKTKRIIELQKEYRTALISEVVTGKIKVTEESTP